MKFQAMREELTKLCGEESALERSQKRLEVLRRSPVGEQARGAAIGAAAGPLLGTLNRAISGDNSPKNLKRKLVAEAVGGALTGGALPILKNRTERGVEIRRQKKLERE